MFFVLNLFCYWETSCYCVCLQGHLGDDDNSSDQGSSDSSSDQGSSIECGRGHLKRTRIGPGSMTTHMTIYTPPCPPANITCCWEWKHVYWPGRANMKVNNRFSCAECGKCLACNRSLVIHMRSHTGERPFACSHCNFFLQNQEN